MRSRSRSTTSRSCFLARRLVLHRRDRARPPPGAGLRCARLGDRVAHRRGLEALDPLGGGDVIAGLERLSANHGPRSSVTAAATFASAATRSTRPERAALLAWLPLTERELAVYEGGLFEGRAGPRDRAARASADDLVPRRGARRPSGCSRAERASIRAVRRDRALRVRADRAPSSDPAPPSRRLDRRAAAVPRAPGRERDRRLGLRARRRRRRPRAGGRRPPARPICLERASSQRALENPG